MPQNKLLACACLLSGVLLTPAALASAIVAPHGAGRDADLAGSTVAAPDDGASALLVNPAGVVGRARDEALVALLPFSFSASYSSPLSGYEGSGSRTPIGLDLWFGLGEIAGWSLGIGAYGALGAAFDLPADPDNGQTAPYTGELAILNFGLNLGRQITPALRVGMQLAPSYGRQRVRTPSPLGDVDFEVDGAGLAGVVGLVYTPTADWSLGLSYRTTGFVDMQGDGHVGGSREKVEVHFVTPQSVVGGVAYRWSPRLQLLGQLRWTRYQDFERGDIEFSQTTLLDQPVIAHTHDRLRWGLGVEFETYANSWLRAAYTQGQAMIDDDALKPILFDHDNKMVMLGYEIDYGRIMLGFTTGYMHLRTRNVGAAENPLGPGRYASDSDLSAGVRLTWKLGGRG